MNYFQQDMQVRLACVIVGVNLRKLFRFAIIINDVHALRNQEKIKRAGALVEGEI